MVRQSMITVALLHKFIYEFRGNNTYIILDGTALDMGDNFDENENLRHVAPQ